MNRIFLALIVIACAFAGFRELTWEAPEPVTIEAVAPPELPDDPTEARLTLLQWEVEQLKSPPPAPPPPAKSPIKELTDAILASAKFSVNLALGLIGAMAFFLGLMKVAEEGGLLLVIARLIRPLMVRLFPEVPPDHPAMGAMILNMSANALGLGNAATPFGIKAMEELNKLNASKGTATNAMCLFLAINTSSVTLLPTGVIVIRDQLGSMDAEGVLPTTLFATLVSTSAAIIFSKIYERFSSVPEPTETIDTSEVDAEAEGAYPEWVAFGAIFVLFLCVPLTVVYGSIVAPWMIPAMCVGLLGYGWAKGVPVYESFIKGAKEGFDIAVMIIPYLVAILCAVGMLRASGALDVFVGLMTPLTSLVGMPAEALPMALLRPLSGSGANGVMTDIMKNAGPDSFTGYLVSTLQGSTETTFYVLAVYFGAVGVKNVRHAVAGALTADFFGVVGALTACHLYFSYNSLW